MIVKIAALVLIFLALLNMILFALGKVNEIFFWLTAIACAIFAYVVMPRLTKKKLAK